MPDTAARGSSAAAASRRMWQLLEPYHALTYFTPECRHEFKEAGLKGFWMGYFAGRAAPLGPASPGLAVATFYNFHPAMVARALPDAWTRASPADVLAARLAGVDASARRLLGAGLEEGDLAEAATVTRAVAEGASPEGRPLFAANAELPWPAEPHLVLWQAATCLREHRGDGHVAALLHADVDGCEAHLTMAATGAVPRALLQDNRGWSDDDWGAAAERLRARGWLDADQRLTRRGWTARRALEDETDRLASDPWRRLGQARTDALAKALEPIAEAIAAARAVPVPNPVGVPRLERMDGGS